MRDRLDELGASTVVALVMFTDPNRLDSYRAAQQPGPDRARQPPDGQAS